MTPAAIVQLLRDVDTKHEEAHHRLRLDVRALENDMQALRESNSTMAHRLTRLESTPMDVAKLHFTPVIVVWIVMGCLSIAGAQWKMNTSLRSDVLDAIAPLKASIESMQRRQELQQFEIQGLKEEILKQHK